MGKKTKKTKQMDARGYATRTSSNSNKQLSASSTGNVSSSSVTVSTKVHANILHLLGTDVATSNAVKETSEVVGSNNATVFDKKTVKKLGSLIPYLSGLKFSEDQIVAALSALHMSDVGTDNSNLKEEAALDWLCLNLATEDLPGRFVDVDVKKSIQEQESDRKITLISQHDDEAGDLVVYRKLEEKQQQSIPPAPTTTIQSAKNDEIVGSATNTNIQKHKESAAVSPIIDKSWIKAYEYEEYTDDEDEDENEHDSNHNRSNYQGGYIVDLDAENESLSVSLSLDKRMLELEFRLMSDEVSLNDEANAYVRSKSETAALKKQVKHRKQQLKGLQKRLQKEQRAAKEKKPVEQEDIDNSTSEEATKLDVDGKAMTNSNDTGEEADQVEGVDSFLGLGALMDDENITAENSQTTVSNFESSIAVEQKTFPSIGKGFLGKLPKTQLFEYCRKKKYPNPTFKPLSNVGKGCRLTVRPKGGDALSFEEEGPFEKIADAQHYLATIALYALDPSMPIYRVLPPEYRDLWLSWVQRDQTEKDNQKEEARELKETHIQSLIDRIVGNSGRVAAVEIVKNTTVVDNADATKDPVEVPDSWDAGSFDDDATEGQKRELAEPTSGGLNLKFNFLKTQQSDHYMTMERAREVLPMWAFKQTLVDTIHNNQVTILHGETGCGKTTQCAQFILEEALLAGYGDKLSLICTQPRRISAISVAERVADEMADDIGGLVGYHIRLESKKSHRTKLLFCTTGVILRRLQDDPLLNGITHVIVDEVHERQWQIDFLLIALRQTLTKRSDLKVILMSATLDANLFIDFFGGAPLISVPGRTFEVNSYFLEDLLEATGHVVEADAIHAKRESWSTKSQATFATGRGEQKSFRTITYDSNEGVSGDYIGYSMPTRISMDRVDEKIVNYDLIEDILTTLLLEPSSAKMKLSFPESDCKELIVDGATLIFLPGLGEIRALSDRLRCNRHFSKRDAFEIIPLHSTISPRDQKRAFLKSKRGCRKIIISTNIAETSITIPDVVCVIDSGLMREVRNSKNATTSALVTDWCSQASAKQRQGRAGRVRPGMCCKLFSSRTAEFVMRPQAMPELQRVPLEEVCLSILAGGMANNCMDFLQQAPQPPTCEVVQTALLTLEEVGAIERRTQQSKPGNHSHYPAQTSTGIPDTLTPLGWHLSKLPIHVRLGKMLIFGSLFKCLDRVLTVAASLSTKSIFSTHMDNNAQAAAAHRTFHHPSSDFLTICNVWDAFQLALANNDVNGTNFCRKYFISFSTLKEISELRLHFLDLLGQIGFIDKSSVRKNTGSGGRSSSALEQRHIQRCPYNVNGRCDNVVSAVICAGLYPNIARVDTASTGTGGLPSLWHKKERLHFHSSSVNHQSKNLQSNWVLFYEKFKVNKRVSLATTATIKPYSLLLFGEEIMVKHIDREVVVDDWIHLSAAAKTGVMFRELRRKLSELLKDMIEKGAVRNNGSGGIESDKMIQGIIDLVSSE